MVVGDTPDVVIDTHKTLVDAIGAQDTIVERVAFEVAKALAVVAAQTVAGGHVNIAVTILLNRQHIALRQLGGEVLHPKLQIRGLGLGKT